MYRLKWLGLIPDPLSNGSEVAIRRTARTWWIWDQTSGCEKFLVLPSLQSELIPDPTTSILGGSQLPVGSGISLEW